MSLPIPPDFHVETVRRSCANPTCRRSVTSEATFCEPCWGRIDKATRRRIIAAHVSRNQRTVVRQVGRAVRALKGKTQ